MNLTVACVFVQGHVGFTPDYVTKLQSMVSRALPAHEFICLTDRPELLPGVRTITVATPRGHYAWWSKLELFNPAHRALQTGRILYLDLDVLITDALGVIATYAPGLCIVPDGAPNFVGKGKLLTVKQYNSSVMSWDGGQCNHLYDKWSPDVAQRLWGDQDWIGETTPDATKMPLEWFPRLSQVVAKGSVSRVMADAKVVLCKKPKNADAAKQWSWFNKAWR